MCDQEDAHLQCGVASSSETEAGENLDEGQITEAPASPAISDIINRGPLKR